MLFFVPMLIFAAASPNSVVLKPVANMYSAPSADADVVSQAIYGSNVAVLESKGDWAKVRTADDYTGWMERVSLRQEGPYAVSGRTVQVESLFANLYREPDVTKHAPVLTIPFESKLEVTKEPSGETERWIEVRLVDGRNAWVQRGDVSFESRTMSIPELVEFSKRFLGLPYTWGGVSTFGYDCSGFTQMLMRRRGVLMPRDAGPQAQWSGLRQVERANLQPGDLVYFGRSAQKITHTGMYLGNEQFINATTHEHPTVRIDKLNDVYWTNLFVAARRLK